MPFNPNIPQANDQLSQSQDDLLQNFQAINTYVAVNHEGFASANAGKHKFVTFTDQSPAPAVAGTDIAMYNAAVSGTQQLHIKKAGGTGVPITQLTLSPGAGYTYLPAGLLLQWGTTLAPITGSTVINFPIAFGSSAFNVQVTTYATNPADTDTFVRLVTQTATNFTVWASPRSTTGTKAALCQWLAIGLV